MRLAICFCFVLLFSSTQAQEEFNYTDDIYLDYIKSVKFHHEGLFTSLPLIDLGSSGQLVLSFDDLEGGDKAYTYEIIHCDKNWKPSDLDEYDFIEGFSGKDIEDISYSSMTYTDYTHYRLMLPNEDLEWTLSGNYLLVVYEDEYDKVPALTRRFMVIEPLVTVLAQVREPMNVQRIRSHHELDFKINYKNYRLVNPMSEIEVVLMQNNRWDNALTGVKPRFVNGDNILFNQVNQHVFPAGKEFRIVDLRSTRYRGEGVHSMDKNRDGIDMLLYLDESRKYKNYHTYDDVNGNFVIESADQRRSDIQSHYVNAFFNLELEVPLSDDVDIYVVGGFSDWKLREDNIMQYDYFRKIYSGQIQLKQGFYDYQYVIDFGDELDYSALEGDWHETENEYSILVYYSEFGSRYDRLIGVANMNSVK